VIECAIELGGKKYGSIKIKIKNLKIAGQTITVNKITNGLIKKLKFIIHSSNNMNKPKIFLITIILILLAGIVLLCGKYIILNKELSQAQAALQAQAINEKVLGFTRLFIKEVLKAQTEVSFDTRLKLETAVRNLEDEEVLNQWQKFVNSKTESEAQEEVKNLLEMLVSKIRLVK